ncbi:YHS domain-containing (seleno)protein [Flagellimonas pacifica]|uniref:YHS domain-containing protein n=1 Tax=Flagellimonas pacifica TaxID=1247520 RepID=A0A285MXP0_9FLAO|nr:YHS domain-containing (seleno)protein [Allomuricauda parva]SNZ00566.1 YHS domain-containing protein [Allomuricauda parva]
MRKKTLKIIGIILVVLSGVIFIFSKTKRITPLSWAHNEVNKSMFFATAINGYDPVAYITVNKAIEGDESYSYKWNDATWFFASEENKNTFKENPEKYTPQYGGFCAFAVSKGFTANSNPNVFELIDGKAYFFADESVKTKWLGSKKENLQLSEKNWN